MSWNEPQKWPSLQPRHEPQQLGWTNRQWRNLAIFFLCYGIAMGILAVIVAADSWWNGLAVSTASLAGFWFATTSFKGYRRTRIGDQ